MLPVKRGIASFSRTSSSRGVLGVSNSSTRRFYTEDSNKNDAKNAYKRILGADEQSAKLDTESNPFSRIIRGSDEAALDDILRPPTSRRAAPDTPPRMRPLSNRINPAPLAGKASDPQYSFPPQRSGRNTSDFFDDDKLGIPRFDGLGGDGQDAASRQASRVFGRQGSSSVALSQVTYRLYVTARPKNCIMTLVDEHAHWRGGISAGQCGFRNAMEGSYEAGYQCAVRILNIVREEIERREEEVRLEIFLSGFGQGRSALLKALTMSEGDGVREAVCKLTDKTPIRIGGGRLQKARRL